MPLVAQVDPGGEIYLQFAKKKIHQWHEGMLRSGVRTLARTILVSDGTTIYINCVYRGQGIFFDRIRILSGGPHGFIVSFSGVNSSLPEAYRSAVIPMTGNKKLATFPSMYSLSVALSRSTQTGGVRDDVLTSGTLTSGEVGVFVNGVFTLTPGVATPRGAFKSAYVTAEGAAAKVMLLIYSDGVVRVANTDVALTSSGPSVIVDNPPFQVNKPGTAISAGRLSADEITHLVTDDRRIMRVDYAAATQVVSEAYVAAPADGVKYGEKIVSGTEAITSSGPAASPQTFFFQGDRSTVEASAFPAVVGVDAAGIKAFIEILVDDAVTVGTDTQSITRQAVSAGEFDEFIGVVVAYQETAEYSYAQKLGLRLPGGATKLFETNAGTCSALWTQDTTEWADTFGHPDHEFSAASTTTYSGASGAVGILYSDPTMPLVVYCYNRLVMTAAGSGAYSDSVAGYADVMMTFTYHYEREVGVLTDTTDRVLFTEVSGVNVFGPVAVITSATIGGVIASSLFTPTKDGFPPIPTIYGFPARANDGWIDFVWPPENSGVPVPFSTTTDVTLHDRLKQAIRSSGYGRLFSGQDVVDNSGGAGSSGFRGFLQIPNAGGGFGPTPTAHRYYISVKDKNNWILLVRKIRNLDGGTINQHEYYAGTLNEATLKRNVHNYLAESAAQGAPPDDAFIAAMAGNDFAAYPIEFWTSANNIVLPMV